jgi:2-oxoglutarate ferredoxin oxidoreductase subunit delta
MGETTAKKEEKKTPRARGKVYIDQERCKGCGYCVEFCPTGVLALSREFNEKGYHPPEVVKAEACTGCDLCGMYCPDFSIFGVRIKDKEG